MMNKHIYTYLSLLFLTFGLLFSSSSMGGEKCFLAKENDMILRQEGDYQTRYSPCSTFKIALSLMGFDAGILENDEHPQWLFQEEYELYLNFRKGVHTPRTWMRDSCVWYSQILTRKLGVDKFKEYIEKFNYGNKDASGDKDKDNGLTQSWLNSSLQISPQEQVEFLQKFIERKLGVSGKAYEITKNIMFVQELWGGWKLYGKTGSGGFIGWFVGFIEKNGRKIVFASQILDTQKQENTGVRARNNTYIQLSSLINELEK